MVRFALLLLLVACGDEAGPVVEPVRPQEPFAFVDATKQAGLTAIAWCGRPEKPHIRKPEENNENSE